jgi:hypothetical protein
MTDNLHEDFARQDEVVGSSDRAFGLTLAVACLLLGTIRLVLGHNYAAWWLGAGLVLLGLALFWTAPLKPLNRLWLRLGLVLYRVVNPIVMLLLFVTTIIPIGALLRLFGKDPLRLRRDPATTSYWLPREPPGPDPKSMINQF